MVAVMTEPTATEASSLRVRGASKYFAAVNGAAVGALALDKVSLFVSAGELVSVVGPSGCGKSTLLRLVAGLILPTEGELLVGDEQITAPNAERGLVFQDPNLFPWLTVRRNIEAGLVARGVLKQERGQVNEFMRLVGLEGFADAFPYQLSGGMRKRVAIAQCWIVEPDILLMDEPFSALDIHTRQRMEGELLQLWSETKQTVVFVTHDLEEAIALSDEVAVLSAGPASHIVGIYPVDLSHPRDVINLRTDAEFTALYAKIWADLRHEVLRSHEQRAVSVG